MPLLGSVTSSWLRHRLGRVEGERATGCCRTWPPPPLSPETATESSILDLATEVACCDLELFMLARKCVGLCFEAAVDFGSRRKAFGEAFGLWFQFVEDMDAEVTKILFIYICVRVCVCVCVCTLYEFCKLYGMYGCTLLNKSIFGEVLRFKVLNRLIF
ncbi:uncharacterized protein [Arachis hypogaea]|uniref:uncharacterized protein isoform X1 n=1 Tax=Arachis hypogaea TaxID=3818 RepID=UPI003B21CDFD